MTYFTNNKIAFALLAALVLLLMVSIFLVIATSAGGIDIAGVTTLKHCVSSGGVCTGF